MRRGEGRGGRGWNKTSLVVSSTKREADGMESSTELVRGGRWPRGAVGRMEDDDWLQNPAEGKKCSLRCSAGANLRLQVGKPVTPA